MNLSLSLLLASAAALGVAGAPAARADAVVVLNSVSHNASLIDPKTYKEIRRVPAGNMPHHMMATPDDDALLVGSTGNNKLIFLDRKNGTVTGQMAMLDPYQLAFSPDRKWFVTAALRMDYVDIYNGADITARRDGAQPVKRVKTGSMPSHLAFSADSKLLYVTEQGAGSVAVIDVAAQKLLQSIKVGPEPAGIWVTLDDKEIWTGVMGSDHIAVIDRASHKVTGKIVTGKGAHNIFPRGDGKHVLVSNRVANTVSLVDWASKKVVDSYSVNGGPDCLEIIPATNEMWVTARWARQVVVIDLTTKAVKGGPDCLEIIPAANEMWVTARWARQVVVVDLTTKAVKAVIPVGHSPHGIYYHAHAPRR